MGSSPIPFGGYSTLAVMVETYQEAFVRRARNGERLATIGQIAATIGHELRNPLAVIDSSLALLRRRVPEDPRIAKHLDLSLEEWGSAKHRLLLEGDFPPHKTPTHHGALF